MNKVKKLLAAALVVFTIVSVGALPASAATVTKPVNNWSLSSSYTMDCTKATALYYKVWVGNDGTADVWTKIDRLGLQAVSYKVGKSGGQFTQKDAGFPYKIKVSHTSTSTLKGIWAAKLSDDYYAL